MSMGGRCPVLSLSAALLWRRYEYLIQSPFNSAGWWCRVVVGDNSPSVCIVCSKLDLCVFRRTLNLHFRLFFTQPGGHDISAAKTHNCMSRRKIYTGTYMIKCFRPVRSRSRRKCQLRTERGWAFISFQRRNSMFENQPRLDGAEESDNLFFQCSGHSRIYTLINQHSSNIKFPEQTFF